MIQPIVGVGDLIFQNYVNMNHIDSADDKGILQEHIENFLTNTSRDEQMIDKIIHCKIFCVKNIEAKVTEVNKAHQAMSKEKSDWKLNSARQSPGVKISHVLTKFLSIITNDSLENTPEKSSITCPDRPSVSKRRFADMAQQIVTEESGDFRPCTYAIDPHYDKYSKDQFNAKTQRDVIEMMKHRAIVVGTDDDE